MAIPVCSWRQFLRGSLEEAKELSHQVGEIETGSWKGITEENTKDTTTALIEKALHTCMEVYSGRQVPTDMPYMSGYHLRPRKELLENSRIALLRAHSGRRTCTIQNGETIKEHLGHLEETPVGHALVKTTEERKAYSLQKRKMRITANFS